ncbi:MAG: putative protein of unknown function acetylesterase [Fibrobacteres bacterium]|nr:putative protein of unknown function acetylesterase [Fibrobacterota bacterium]
MNPASRPASHRIPVLRLLAAAAAAITIFACTHSTEPQLAGGTTDTGNTIVGLVLDAEGASAGRADLSLRRSDYLSRVPALGKAASKASARTGTASEGRASRLSRAPVDILDTTTDAVGAFRLDSVVRGSYRLEVRQGGGLGCLFDSLSVTDTAALKVDGVRLAKTARVGGTVILRPDALRGFVQVYGMERLMPVNTATGRFDLTLPAGAFTLRFVDPEGGTATVKLKDIRLGAGDSLDVGTVDLRDSASLYREWSDARRLWINTTASGAGMDKPVFGFPMLVRLDASMIDFGKAAPKGADLRFSKAGSKVPLAYEIERWDAAAKRAEVWVRMDTIAANASDRYILMHWGNPAAEDSSDGAAVFDTALGFAGVWHLSEGSNDPGFPGYLDATANRNTGRGVAIVDTTVGPGAIGLGQRLDGAGAYIHVPDAASLDMGKGDFCLSVWARPDAIFRNHQLVSKRVTTGGDLEFQLRSDGMVESYLGSDGPSEVLRSRGKAAAGEWHLFTMRRAGLGMGFYVDGVLDTALTTAATYDVDNDADLFFGHDAQHLPEDWQGGLDEVRLSRRAMPEEWLRLSYLNQVSGSKMIGLFRP